MDGLNEALAYLERGDWEAAHRIVQENDSPFGCWAHGIVHIMEGDLGNAGYWYRRAGRRLPDEAGRPDQLAAEIAALRAAADGAA